MCGRALTFSLRFSLLLCAPSCRLWATLLAKNHTCSRDNACSLSGFSMKDRRNVDPPVLRDQTRGGCSRETILTSSTRYIAIGPTGTIARCLPDITRRMLPSVRLRSLLNHLIRPAVPAAPTAAARPSSLLPIRTMSTTAKNSDQVETPRFPLSDVPSNMPQVSRCRACSLRCCA